MKVNKKLLALSSSIILLPVLFGLYAWQDLPNRMATHFGPTGQADSWASKPFVILFIPLFLLGLHLFGIFVTNRDPKSQMTSLKIRYLVYAIVPFMSVFSQSICTGKILDMLLIRLCLSDWLLVSSLS